MMLVPLWLCLGGGDRTGKLVLEGLPIGIITEGGGHRLATGPKSEGVEQRPWLCPSFSLIRSVNGWPGSEGPWCERLRALAADTAAR